jgi:hypothetical protein
LYEFLSVFPAYREGKREKKKRKKEKIPHLNSSGLLAADISEMLGLVITLFAVAWPLNGFTQWVNSPETENADGECEYETRFTLLQIAQ